MAFVFLALCPFLVAACSRPTDFTGFWKVNCTDAFGVQIKKQSVSFCGPGGCFAPGEWTPNTAIVGDPKYRVLNPTTIEIGHRDGQGWTRYTRCTTDTNPVLDYATMPAPKSEATSAIAASEANTGSLSVQTEADPHRPTCTDASCQKIKTFLKEHYCGESPFGNGPDDGCELQVVGRKPGASVKALADYECDWDEKKEEYECHQKGEPPSTVRSILVHELRQLGLPANANGITTFKVWQSTRGGTLIATADYHRVVGSDIELCETIVAIDGDSHVLVIRKLPFQKTDADVPQVTQWSLVDLADVDQDGNVEVILEGDAYEDHWLEVVTVHDGATKTIFSGLGYYL
jgi:hypothetical protein